jgi:hypothetical protein
MVDYSISTKYSELRLTMEGGSFNQDIPLSKTKPNFGGIRWWYKCPKCELRVSRLYRPLNEHCFFCRHCHNLDYESMKLSGTALGRDLKIVVAEKLKMTRYEARLNEALKYKAHPFGVFALNEVKYPLMNRVRDRRTGLALKLTKTARQRGLSF